MSCIYSYRFWNVLTILSTFYVTNCPVYTSTDLKYIICVTNCNTVPYIYFPHVTLKYINCIINCNIVPYSYSPHVLLLHILYIQLQTVKCINCIFVPYSYFPHVLLLHILYTHLQTLKYINYIIKCYIVQYSYIYIYIYIYIIPMFSYSISSVYIATPWSRVLLEKVTVS